MSAVKFFRYFALCLAACASSACGDADSLGGDVAALGGNAGASGSGGTAGASGSGGAGRGGSGGALGSGSGGVPDEATLKLGPFPVEPGQESFVCQTFGNPFGGANVYIREFESHMTPGSHHFIMNAVLEAPNELGPCSGLEPPGGPFSTQLADDVFTYPEGVAARLAGQNLKLVSHYFNASRMPLNGEVTVTLRRAHPDTVRQVAFVGALIDDQLSLPPGQSQTVSGGITLSEEQEYDVFWILPHMHTRGTEFSVTVGPGGANVIYQTDRWETPSRRFDPPLRLASGDSLNYSCSFFNDTARVIGFGPSVVNNEMCMLAYHYTNLKDPRSP